MERAGSPKILFGCIAFLRSQFTCRDAMSEIFTLVLIFSKKAEEKDIIFQICGIILIIIKAFFLFNSVLIY
ncbi:MAG: hypothetical protein CM15mP98_01220 [Paracoccaceae bacterium]|nr:MAG: hypothetical protein CM15mP98_01220 [Paracoccaceae bacterium]